MEKDWVPGSVGRGAGPGGMRGLEMGTMKKYNAHFLLGQIKKIMRQMRR